MCGLSQATKNFEKLQGPLLLHILPHKSVEIFILYEFPIIAYFDSQKCRIVNFRKHSICFQAKLHLFCGEEYYTSADLCYSYCYHCYAFYMPNLVKEEHL